MIVNGTKGPVAGVFCRMLGRSAEVRSAGGHSFYREILLMSLFYLIEEHNRVGAPWNSFEGLTAFFST